MKQYGELKATDFVPGTEVKLPIYSLFDFYSETACAQFPFRILRPHCSREGDEKIAKDLKPRLQEQFFARAGDASFSNFVASPARDENRKCSHP